MLELAFYVFGATMLGGLVLAALVLGRRQVPQALPWIHGAAGATGIVLVLAYLLRAGAAGLVVLGLVILIGAAAGGLYLAHRHPRDRSPDFVVFMHAFAAVTGVLVIGMVLYQR